MNLEKLKRLFAENGCSKIYIKRLSPNDNSKNQVYFGGSFEILNILPLTDIRAEAAGDWKKERFKASLRFSWIDEDGILYPAPQAQLILYPKYPEVRFSGFLSRCEKPPSELMTTRLANRLLFFAVAGNGAVLGYVAHPASQLAQEFAGLNLLMEHGVFSIIELPRVADNRLKLIQEMHRIHELGWIKSKRLDKTGRIVSCEAPNCGGYTLEAELGITPNGYSEPDFLGWEVKQFGVSNFERINSAVITLMTPEPTDGIYKTEGVEAFIRKYGYNDIAGREDRMNFGGVHKTGVRHQTTGLEMRLIGFDSAEGKIRSATGRIALVDSNDIEAASWSFSSMLLHWNRKHSNACYVPSRSNVEGGRRYKYGNLITLGSGTDFQLFLGELSIGNIYYDPGIKLENASTHPRVKRRSQFRTKFQVLKNLYKENELVDVSLTL